MSFVLLTYLVSCCFLLSLFAFLHLLVRAAENYGSASPLSSFSVAFGDLSPLPVEVPILLVVFFAVDFLLSYIARTDPAKGSYCGSRLFVYGNLSALFALAVFWALDGQFLARSRPEPFVGLYAGVSMVLFGGLCVGTILRALPSGRRGVTVTIGMSIPAVTALLIHGLGRPDWFRGFESALPLTYPTATRLTVALLAVLLVVAAAGCVERRVLSCLHQTADLLLASLWLIAATAAVGLIAPIDCLCTLVDPPPPAVEPATRLVNAVFACALALRISWHLVERARSKTQSG